MDGMNITYTVQNMYFSPLQFKAAIQSANLQTEKTFGFKNSVANSYILKYAIFCLHGLIE